MNDATSDIALASYMNNATSTDLALSAEKGGVDLGCIKNHLDNLFYLAEGSTTFNKKLRHTFYKVL